MTLSRDDYVWPSPPGWLPQPIRRVVGDLTYDEAHGLLMGLTGLFAGAGFVAGGVPRYVASVGTLLLVAVVLLDVPGESGFVSHVLSQNGWYWLVSYTLTAVLGAWVMA